MTRKGFCFPPPKKDMVFFGEWRRGEEGEVERRRRGERVGEEGGGDGEEGEGRGGGGEVVVKRGSLRGRRGELRWKLGERMGEEGGEGEGEEVPELFKGEGEGDLLILTGTEEES